MAEGADERHGLGHVCRAGRCDERLAVCGVVCVCGEMSTCVRVEC